LGSLLALLLLKLEKMLLRMAELNHFELRSFGLGRTNAKISSMGGVRPFLRTLASKPISLFASRLPRGEHVTRYFMYRELSTTLSDPGKGKTVLSISHSQYLTKILGLREARIVEANYPEYRATDLKAFSDETFDYVISDQVLEHVEGNPQDVFDETFRLLKPGGIAVHTTCFMNPIHGAPSDFWRFTPAALKYLARRFGEILKVGGFGNRAIWVAEALGLRFTPVPHAKWHPLHIIATRNNPKWPVTTWIVVRK
jgi:SAM-dependent methyltransferase